MNDPVDICCICGTVGEYGTFTEVNEVDFGLLCPKCKNKRCDNCTSYSDFYCPHIGKIQNPKTKVCENWKAK